VTQNGGPIVTVHSESSISSELWTFVTRSRAGKPPGGGRRFELLRVAPNTLSKSVDRCPARLVTVRGQVRPSRKAAAEHR
jgi:hypothetical protein